MNKVQLVTIGAYGFDADTFFAALQAAKVDTFCDIRRRRGVRGAEYAFANSQRLQQRLAELGIRYVYRQELAPSNAIRTAQYAVDKQTKTAKRQRTALSPAFIAAYEESCLANFAPKQFLAELPNDARVIAFFCVEREPAACHRSLLAHRLAQMLGLEVIHLLPE
ncbi:MAG: DUF488 domain-containing protein [Caldilinea sp. CFX5]|nr:DUF488 domain-containing protein [Caldilinea sp. CFX5]